MAAVKVNIRPPLSYGVSKKVGGLIMKEDIGKEETLGKFLARLERRSPAAFKQIFDPVKGQIRKPVITIVNGDMLSRAEAMQRILTDGDKIVWFFTYAGG